MNEIFKVFTGNTFSSVLGRLSSCDHLDVEKPPSVRKMNGKAAERRYIGRYDRVQTFRSKMQVRLSTCCVPTCVGTGLQT